MFETNKFQASSAAALLENEAACDKVLWYGFDPDLKKSTLREHCHKVPFRANERSKQTPPGLVLSVVGLSNVVPRYRLNTDRASASALKKSICAQRFESLPIAL
jgi:hypothetical protein